MPPVRRGHQAGREMGQPTKAQYARTRATWSGGEAWQQAEGRAGYEVLVRRVVSGQQFQIRRLRAVPAAAPTNRWLLTCVTGT